MAADQGPPVRRLHHKSPVRPRQPRPMRGWSAAWSPPHSTDEGTHRALPLPTGDWVPSGHNQVRRPALLRFPPSTVLRSDRQMQRPAEYKTGFQAVPPVRQSDRRRPYNRTDPPSTAPGFGCFCHSGGTFMRQSVCDDDFGIGQCFWRADMEIIPVMNQTKAAPRCQSLVVNQI